MRFKSAALSLPSHHYVVGIMPKPTPAQRWQAAKEGVHRNRTTLWVLGGVAAAIALYQALFLLHPFAGLYGTVTTLVALAVLGITVERYRGLAIAASLLPLATMVTLSLPQDSALAQSGVFYAVLLLLGLTYRYLYAHDEPNSDKLGWRAYARGIPLMVVYGQLLAGAAYALLRHDYPYEASTLGWVAVCAVVFAFAEEVVFRGFIQERASRLLHPAGAAVFAAVVYAAMSISLGSWAALAFGLVAGSLLSAAYYATRSVLLTTVLNATAKLMFLGLLATYVL